MSSATEIDAGIEPQTRGTNQNAANLVNPRMDAEKADAEGARKNFAKVGSSRPSSLLYTYGPGAVMDLPHFTVMPLGLDSWERIWARREEVRQVHAPRLLEAVRTLVGRNVDELREFPWQPTTNTFSNEGADLGVPSMVFPQWLRCTGCNRLAPLDFFDYTNSKRFRPDEATFEHATCHGVRGNKVGKRGPQRRTAVPARYLLACADGHLDEFPYDWWVHGGGACPKVDVPVLKMVDRVGGKGASATIACDSCGAKRPMNEAQGDVGRSKLPACRARDPHLEGFDPKGCKLEPRLMLIGASNLWFPALQSIVDMPRMDPAERQRDDADRMRVVLGEDLKEFVGHHKLLRRALGKEGFDVTERSDSELDQLMEIAREPRESEERRRERKADWDPVDLLVPEWNYLQQEPASERHADEQSGLTLSPRKVSSNMPGGVDRVLAVDRLRKVNALVGFTRIDEVERVNDVSTRMVPLTNGEPTWTVATEDRGEGVFLQLDDDAVRSWETKVKASQVWEAHLEAHRNNFERRFSETAADVDPDSRLRPPRYWLLHTLAHALIREMAMYSGYGAASLSERIYAWEGSGDERPPAAGVLICTTASDSDGTLGGLVRLSQEEDLARIVRNALYRASRCSSDPVCAKRLPRDPEDFLHGAACHCCVMASETSCERANRFLDRRFIVPLQGPDAALSFFGAGDVG